MDLDADAVAPRHTLLERASECGHVIAAVLLARNLDAGFDSMKVD